MMYMTIFGEILTKASFDTLWTLGTLNAIFFDIVQPITE